MIERMNPNDTLYTIYLSLENDCTIQIGKLGTFLFNKGTYIYVGSAKRQIESRINRHKKMNKKLHWHFDYLRPFGVITKIITYENSSGECGLYREILEMTSGITPIKGFGSSDCNCISHLIYIGVEA